MSNDTKFISMDRLISQEKPFTKLLIRKIKSLNPNLVLIEKGMAQPVINELAAMQMTAIINIKSSILQMISRLTEGKVLQTIDEASHGPSFGHCKEFFVRKGGHRPISFIKDCKDASLGGTILLSGPNMDELTKVKKVIRQLVIEFRNIALERVFFEQMKMDPRTISVFLDHFSSSTRIQLFSTVSKKQLCRRPQLQEIEYYKSNDCTLGSFLLKLALSVDEICTEPD